MKVKQSVIQLRHDYKEHYIYKDNYNCDIIVIFILGQALLW